MTAEEFQKFGGFIVEWEGDGGEYSVFSKNCLDFVVSALEHFGKNKPPHGKYKHPAWNNTGRMCFPKFLP